VQSPQWVHTITTTRVLEPGSGFHDEFQVYAQIQSQELNRLDDRTYVTLSERRIRINRQAADEAVTFKAKVNQERQAQEMTNQMHYLNANAPSRVHPFTKTGFGKGRIPEAMLLMLRKFVADTPPRQEKFPGHYNYINFETVPTAFRDVHQIDSGTRDGIVSELKTQLEAWSGIEGLEFTALYGARTYFNGSSLRPHVENMDTHVISAVIQIDQDVQEDWALEVAGNDGVASTVFLSPGDVAYYESAKVVHGRPRPLIGTNYTSLCIHFKPPNWKLILDDFIQEAGSAQGTADSTSSREL